MNLRRGALLIAVCALLVGACGSDSDDGAESPPSVSGDTALAQEALVTLADLPDGWGPAEVGFRAIERVLADLADTIEACDGGTVSLGGDSVDRAVVSFDHEDGATLSVALYVYGDADEAADRFADSTSDESGACIQEVLSLGVGADLATEGFTSVAGLGDAASTLRLEGGTAERVEYTEVLVDRGVVTWSLNGADVDLQEHLDAQVGAFDAALAG